MSDRQTSCDSAEVIELVMKASSFTKSASCQIRFLIRPRIWVSYLLYKGTHPWACGRPLSRLTTSAFRLWLLGGPRRPPKSIRGGPSSGFGSARLRAVGTPPLGAVVGLPAPCCAMRLLKPRRLPAAVHDFGSSRCSRDPPSHAVMSGYNFECDGLAPLLQLVLYKPSLS